MGIIESIVFYLLVALGIILFIKLDKRISLVNRLLIAVVAIVVLFLLFLFISAIITIIIVVVIVLFLLSLLKTKNIKFRR